MTNTTTTKTAAARKGSPTPAKSTTTKPAAKRKPKSSELVLVPNVGTTVAAKPAKTAKPKTEKLTRTKPAAAAPKRELDAKTADELNRLHGQLVNATSAFELAVVDLLTSGESPTHIANALHIANSSVRRIGFRHGFGIDPAKR